MKERLQNPEDTTFSKNFIKSINPLLIVGKRDQRVDRLVSFVASFISDLPPDQPKDAEFLVFFLGYLIALANAADKAVRFRVCQLVGEIMSRLPEDFEMSDELVESITEMGLLRLKDKIPAIRCQAIGVLSRLQRPDEDPTPEQPTDPVLAALVKVMCTDTSNTTTAPSTNYHALPATPICRLPSNKLPATDFYWDPCRDVRLPALIPASPSHLPSRRSILPYFVAFFLFLTGLDLNLMLTQNALYLDVRLAALTHIAFVPQTLPAIVGRLRDVRPEVRQHALQVLSQRVSFHELAPDLRRLLLECAMNDRNGDVQSACGHLLSVWMSQCDDNPCQFVYGALLTAARPAASPDFQNSFSLTDRGLPLSSDIYSTLTLISLRIVL
ncbi:putative Condensin complex subunit 3 [Paratrimastix pyriformis]|uniref:Condensin complex subunit 3 n=1 Tax=Paratrimastix pyriformis TaxID=342808 RepID=A0ABQ8UE63_9EUKA|nr:putative Condensin complex subunit 3 [Paratrimastix pyriformis]